MAKEAREYQGEELVRVYSPSRYYQRQTYHYPDCGVLAGVREEQQSPAGRVHHRTDKPCGICKPPSTLWLEFEWPKVQARKGEQA